MGESHANSVERARTEEVRILPYDPTWPDRFAEEASFLKARLPPELIGRIEHFGSTAVPGLAAKPIVDMLIEVPSLREVHQRIAPILKDLGYEYFWRPSWRDPLVPEYTWFIKRDGNGRRTHHLHMLEPDSADWDRLRFRDYLIAHPDVAQEYEILKRDLAAATRSNRLAYAQAKTDFITAVTERARDANSGD